MGLCRGSMLQFQVKREQGAATACPGPGWLRLVLSSAEFLGESDEKPLRPTDIAEPIRVFVLDYFAYELRAARTEPFKRLVDVVHGKHDRR